MVPKISKKEWLPGEKRQKWITESEWEYINFLRQYLEVQSVLDALLGGFEEKIRTFEIDVKFDSGLSMKQKEEIFTNLAILRIGLMKAEGLKSREEF